VRSAHQQTSPLWGALVARLFNTRTKVMHSMHLAIGAGLLQFSHFCPQDTFTKAVSCYPSICCVIYAQIMRKSIEKFLFLKIFYWCRQPLLLTEFSVSFCSLWPTKIQFKKYINKKLVVLSTRKKRSHTEYPSARLFFLRTTSGEHTCPE